MPRDQNAAPVVIKRKKVVGGDGHHGGAWKVAYADFVTAMMAFFLLMWLLNATTEKQRKGIADYFSPSVPISRVSGGGDGDFGGDSVFSEEVMPRNGTGVSHRRPTSEDRASGVSGVDSDGAESKAGSEDENRDFAKVEEALMGLGGETMATENPLRHVVTRVTDEGLVIELFDLPDRPLFDSDGNPTDIMTALGGLLAQVSALVGNAVAIEGHVASQPIVANEQTTWPDSIARAEILRGLVARRGLEEKRVTRIAGHADREPAARNPLSERNNRIEYILLRSDV